MKAFAFSRPSKPEQVSALLPGATLKASGIDLLDRMKEHLDEPERVVGLVDVAGIRDIVIEEDGTIQLGAAVTLHQLATHEALHQFVPSLAEAAGAAASAQIRRRATIAGNIAQHTRCGYYRHESFPCLKRGADACPVLKDGAVQDFAGIFDNATCASGHPSSVAPVLGSLDAQLLIEGPKGEQRVAPFDDVWAQPKQGVRDDLALAEGEWIRAVHLPPQDRPQRFGYEEVRQKQAFDWALVSCAVRIVVDAGNKVSDARVYLGSVAPIPYRAREAEAALLGKSINEDTANQAADAALAKASPLAGNTYKADLTRVAIRRALLRAGKDSR